MSFRSKINAALGIALFVLASPSPTLAQSANLPRLSKLGVPDANWMLQIQTDGFVLQQTQIEDDGFGTMMMASNPKTLMVMSVYLERAPHKGDSHEARRYYWGKTDKNTPKKDDIKLSDFADLPIVEYMVKSFQGSRVNQKSVNAYLAKGDVWIDVHLSKVDFSPADQELFDSILRSIRIDESGGTNSIVYAQYGSDAYLKGDYKTAIKYYATAVELNKRDHQMKPIIWRVVVDNLGMAYGMTGELINARKTFEYGLSEDPGYPMFHYNMGCTYAEMGDLDQAIASLRKAFSLKANMNPGEPMPNPATDSSLKRFLKDEKFRKFLSEIGANN
ncbi:MAG TPA: tetratricopeptide repeat protein [Blastocatellia bacterium]|nr:tetratricopeptide repeat protein [Blastocatellia bacterium]